MKAPKPGPGGFVGDPYPLDVCIVGNEPLGANAVTVVLKDMADPLQENRQIRFCCEQCVAKFRAEPARYIAALDQAIIERFDKDFPLDRCLVMLEETLDDDAERIVYANRVYRLCCRKCITNFQKQTERYSQAYERMLAAKQRSTYPLKTCVVTGASLPEKPYDLVIGARLVRLADADAAKRFYEDPARYLKAIDDAR
jgi:YHS domain-containing protein